MSAMTWILVTRVTAGTQVPHNIGAQNIRPLRPLRPCFNKNYLIERTKLHEKIKYKIV